MAARNATVGVTKQTWTQLTDADVTSITFQNASGYDVLIKATTDTTAPTDQDDVLVYGPGLGERNSLMTDLFPGLTGADRVWAYCSAATASVFVSHAA